MTATVPTWASTAVQLAYPTIFVTVSGAHLYGFASHDSDLDLRATHLLSATEVLGLHTGPETLQSDTWRDGVELDVVSHDLLKFARLLNSRNGYVLEQLLSPLVIHTSDTHRALIDLSPGLITRHHAHHYLGFAATQLRLLDTTNEIKPALYTLRVLHTGLHLMRTGTVQSDLRTFDTPPYVADLIALKLTAEHSGFPATLRPQFLEDVTRLRTELEAARDSSPLPAHPDPAAVTALHNLVVTTRLTTV
ncbi:nucleotidyltransferase domain-containing protein [Winogradskya consettensis]|uniref:Nucleotidyltransferase n=1 Tax=Winogradskya consettensis TaxID=113560 RepID=A0A919VP50_9ACTN|nr:nucleotidyltransferase domain-containing protein [Actinoplanes consettensis]GIM70555.1 nucleotidyltransferase [Actinoplanes consettensis]